MFYFAGFPLPLLLGPMAGCLVAALAGARMEGLGMLGTIMRTLLGLAIGASVTPEVIGKIAGMAISISLIPVFVLTIVGAGYPFFRYVARFDPTTSFYAAVPGGLQEMLLFGEEDGGNIRAMSLIHATRVCVIFAVVPVVVNLLLDISLFRPPGPTVASIPLSQTAIMLSSAAAGYLIARLMRVPGASILGPLILTAILSLGGVISQPPPVELIWMAQFFIGLGVGVRYVGITGRELREYVVVAIGYCLLTGLVCLAFIAGAQAFLPFDLLDVALAFLPGGQAEMALIAIIAGADVAYVAAHHVSRLMFVILCSRLLGYVLRKSSANHGAGTNKCIRDD